MTSASVNAQPRWVYKLGGGTLADAAVIRHSLASVPQRAGTVLVVSAPAGVTDQLCAVNQARAQGQGREARARMHQVVRHFQQLANALLPANQAQVLVAEWESWVRQNLDSASPARMLARGELWNAQLLAHYLNQHGRPARAVDARRFVLAEADAAEAEVVNLAGCLPCARELAVITGFIARDAQGADHTLGRDGSDYTAALVAEALVNEGLVSRDGDACWQLSLHFLTDTPGIRSADPRRLNGPGLRIPCIGHREARTLVHWGGGVLHSRTIKPLARAQIRAWVGQPAAQTDARAAGTWLVPGNHWPAGGLGIFVTGTRRKGERETQATLDAARLVLPAPLESELNPLQQAENQRSQAALVQACQEFWPTAESYGAGVEIALPAAGAAADDTALNTLLNQVHRRCYETVSPLRLVLLGPGLVGREFLRQLQQVDLLWRLRYGLAVEVVQVVNSRGTQRLADPDQHPVFDPENSHLQHGDGAPLVVVDATASAALAQRHRHWLAQGAAVLTANKFALAGELDSAQQLLRHPLYAASTTVGAGLPFIQLLQQWQGGRIESFEAILSGSVNALISLLEQGLSYPLALRRVQQQGLLEPDPSADLEGWDSARKLLILARALGLPAEANQIRHQALLNPRDPEPLLQLLAQAKAQQQRLRYVARWQEGQLSLAPQLIPYASPLAIDGCENILCAVTDSGQQHTLRGPGAGPEVTARGLLEDLLKLAQALQRSPAASRAA